MLFRLFVTVILPFSVSTIQAQQELAIVNVNLVDVESSKVLPSQTVLVRDGKIVKLGPAARTKPSAGATVIDGTGKYLMPGLVDAHVHFFQSGGLYTRPDAINLTKQRPYAQEIKWTHDNMEDILRRYLASGITSVLDVGATYNFLKQRDTFQTKTYAPSIAMSGPLLTTYLPPAFKGLKDDEPFKLMKTEEEARQFVREQLAYQPDFIKIWYILLGQNKDSAARQNLPLVRAAIDEAHKNNLRVAVHATERITAQLAVENGADFLVHNVDDEVVSDAFVQLLRQKKTVLIPTMVVMMNYLKVFAQEYVPSKEDYLLAPPETLGSLFDLRHLPDTNLTKMYRGYAQGQKRDAARTDSISRINLKKLADGGVTIATGTDAGNIGTLHVSSYFEELRAMRAAGLSIWQIIKASTLNASVALNRASSSGSIRPGKNGDMILLKANPLDSLANWKLLEAVINKGVVWHPDSLVRSTAIAPVLRQLNAYNGHDLDAFLEPYSDSIEVYDNFKLIMKGKSDMRSNYLFVERSPLLHCEILNRIVDGNKIFDQEKVRIAEGRYVGGTAMYIIEKGKIVKMYFF